MIRLTHSLKGFDLHKAAVNFDSAVYAGVRAVGVEFDQAVKFEIQRTYSRPIPTVAQVARFRRGGGYASRGRATTGAKAWQRTGELKKGRGVQFPDRWTAEVAIRNTRAANAITNYPGGYAQHLHDYTPRNPAIGISRRNQFFTAAAQKVGPRVADTFQGEFDRTLG